ncbi:MAG TPA: NADH-quinone oxidoreductase subunit N [Bacteroidota bacterium]|jgi:NADH-quinone oxidoreductase subunit N|nr:NADH-quinone oxidoreductase subunit N [Bacteroidota bacterium]
MSESSLFSIAPLLAVTAMGLLVLIVEALVTESENLSYWVTVLGLSASGILSYLTMQESAPAYNGMITVGGYGNYFTALFIVSALLTTILSRDYLKKTHTNFGEFYLLIIFSTIGMMLIASANDLIMVFLGIELMSICLYVLAGFMRRQPSANEASLKYFLLGAFATGFLLYGIALIYGATGTTNIPAIIEKFPSQSLLFWSGIGLLLIGFAFKAGAVPFHMWIPDVYQGSPTTVSGFMSTGAKAAAFSAFVLVFAHQFQGGEKLRTALSVLAAASMILGNIVAIAQSNIKRMLAYSSVAHAGYMIIGLAAGNALGKSGIVFYLTSYMFMNIGAFGILSILEQEGEKNLTFEDYAGLGRKKPLLAAMMSVFMLSLAGLPPFGGFFGKYYIFVAAVNSNLTWLAIIGVVMSVVSVYYYLRLVMVMYFQENDSEVTAKPAMASFVVLAIATLAVLQLGVFPSSLLSIINTLF